MTLETLFSIANYAVLPFWLLLLVAPRWRWTGLLVHGPVVVLLLAPLYGYMLFGYGGGPENVDMTSLYGVVEGFSAPSLALAGWIHYLIFDLFIGAWEARDAMRRNLPHLAVVPCLLGTLLVGPLGLLLYVVVRFVASRVVQYDEYADAPAAA
ncbi:MAG: ABA4-like family protein [Myxococcota bacterium]